MTDTSKTVLLYHDYSVSEQPSPSPRLVCVCVCGWSRRRLPWWFWLLWLVSALRACIAPLHALLHAI